MSGELGRLSWLPTPEVLADPDAFLSEVLTGWKRQQLSRKYGVKTVNRRTAAVLRMASFAGSYPWEWRPSDADDFFAHLRGVENLTHNTVRAYQGDVKLFLEYASDPAYDWNENCGRLFGSAFSQVVTTVNRSHHVQETPEGSVRPFSVRELQEFFYLADLELERVLRAGRRGALAAWRDAVAFKTLYTWGLRLNEMRHLIVADYSRNIRTPAFGEWGVLRVRMGKAMKGSPPKQRTVLTVFDWSADMIDHWVRAGLPRFELERATPLFPTETGQQLDPRNLRRKFHQLVDELGLVTSPGVVEIPIGWSAS